MEEVFCPLCGGPTLEKISYTIQPDGTAQYNISRRQRSFKGTIVQSDN